MSTSDPTFPTHFPFGVPGVPDVFDESRRSVPLAVDGMFDVAGDDAEARLVTYLADRIESGRDPSAARALLQAVVVGVVPPGTDVLGWLCARVGGDAPAAVVRGIAGLASSCCRGGFERCADCDGTGDTEGRPCPDCAGFGRRRCDFCNGTGLLQYQDLPASLRAEVAGARVRRVATLVHVLAECDAPRGSRPPHVGDAKVAVINLAKLLGVLENAVIELRHAGPADRRPELLHNVTRLAGFLHHRRTAALRELARAWTAAAAAGGPAAQVALDHAGYHAGLVARGSLRGTSLANPFLFESDKDRVADA